RHEGLRPGIAAPYVMGVDPHRPCVDCRGIGFDGTVAFEPQLGALPYCVDDGLNTSTLIRNLKFRVISPHLKIYDSATARPLMMDRERSFPFHPCVLVGWDNTPRRGSNGIVIINSTPESFESGLAKVVQSVLE